MKSTAERRGHLSIPEWRHGLTALAVAAAFVLPVGCAAPDEPVRLAAASKPRPLAARGIGLLQASASGKYLAGAHAQRTRDYAAAADYLSRALDVDRKNRNLRRRAFLALLTSGRMKAAMQLAAVISETDPKMQLVQLVLALEDARDGKFKDADKRLEAMPRRGLNKFTLPLLRAWVHAGLGDFDAAIEALQPLSKVTNFTVVYDLHSALIHDLSGDAKAAEEAYLKAGKSQPTLRIVKVLGSFYERTGRGAEAKTLYEKFIAEHDETDILDPALARIAAGGKPPAVVGKAVDGIAEVFYNLSNTLTRGRSSEHALIYGRLAVYLRSDFAPAQMLLAGILETLSREQEANGIYDDISSSSTLQWSAQLRKAANLDIMGKTDEAIEHLSRLAEQRKSRSDALINLGNLLRGKKRYKESIAAYSKALDRIMKVRKQHWALLYARGISYERSKSWLLAEKDFLRALELRPGQPYVLNYLGYSWIDQGINLDRARKMIERAVKSRPNDGYIVDSLGWALYRMGDYTGAAKRLEQAVLLRPEDPTINDHLGDAYWRVGRQLEAQFQWKRVLTLDPDAGVIPTVRQKIRQGLSDTLRPGKDG